MRVVGFQLKKISADKKVNIIEKKPGTSIEFIDLDKEKSDIFKENELLKITYKYAVVYGENEKESEGGIEIIGHIILSVDKDESKDILKAWKKKKLPEVLNINLFNIILKRCTPKAVFLEDEVGLPIHTPMPRLQPKKEDQ